MLPSLPTVWYMHLFAMNHAAVVTIFSMYSFVCISLPHKWDVFLFLKIYNFNSFEMLGFSYFLGWRIQVNMARTVWVCQDGSKIWSQNHTFWCCWRRWCRPSKRSTSISNVSFLSIINFHSKHIFISACSTEL